MFAVNALAYIPSSTTPPAQVASFVAPAESAIGNLPALIVGRSVADPEVQPDAHFISTSSTKAEPAVSSPFAAIAGATGQPIGSGNISSFPSLFLTQLLGQDSGASAQELVLTYETMLEFSQVKYRPSNTLLPPPSSPMLDFFKSIIAEQGATPAPVATPDAPVQMREAQTPPPQIQAQAQLHADVEIKQHQEQASVVTGQAALAAAGAKEGERTTVPQVRAPLPAPVREPTKKSSAASAYQYTIQHNNTRVREEEETLSA